MSTPSSSAVRALALEYKSLQEEPVEGFRVKLLNDDNLFEWEVAIFGPPDTLYQGGYFKVSCFFFIHLFSLFPDENLSAGVLASVSGWLQILACVCCMDTRLAALYFMLHDAVQCSCCSIQNTHKIYMLTLIYI